MTDQELRKLKRPELLEMMIQQGKVVAEYRETMEEVQGRLEIAEALNARLKKKLDRKDQEILIKTRQMEQTFERLRNKLDDKDELIRRLQEELEAEKSRDGRRLQEAGSPQEATALLNHILERAQRAAGQYLELMLKERQPAEEQPDPQSSDQPAEPDGPGEKLNEPGKHDFGGTARKRAEA